MAWFQYTRKLNPGPNILKVIYKNRFGHLAAVLMLLGMNRNRSFVSIHLILITFIHNTGFPEKYAN